MKRIFSIAIVIITLVTGILVGSVVPSVYAGSGGPPLYVNVSSNGINIYGEHRGGGWNLNINGDPINRIYVNGECVYPKDPTSCK